MAGVFLSYAPDDKVIADRLVRDLRVAGVPVWYDAELSPAGPSWQPLLTERIAEADALIVLISPDSRRSGPMTRDGNAAVARTSWIVPVLVNGARPDDVPAEFADRPNIDLGAGYYAGLKRLVSAIGEPNDQPLHRSVGRIDLSELVEDEAARARREVEQASDLVFVVSSFEPEMQSAFDAIASAARTVGLRAEWLKDAQGDYRITDQILAKIREARLLVVDLTFERPNVYFELGYARGIGKTVVTIARVRTIVHVDVRDWTYLSYEDSRPLEDKLVKRFKHELGRL